MLEKQNSSKLTFLQNNVGRRANSMHTCLQIGVDQKIDFILFQEPWMSDDNTFTISHSNYYCILPENKNVRSRVAIFARKKSNFQACLRSDICSDNDLLIIDIQDNKNQYAPIQLINIYNEKSLMEQNNSWTVNRSLLQLMPTKNSIICGDFNAHHPWWNSEIISEIRSQELVDWLLFHDFTLINEPDRPTYFRQNLQRKSIIDLTFISAELNESLTNWFIDDEEASGSDHEIIRFSVKLGTEELTENPLYANQYNFEKADWERILTETERLSKTKNFNGTRLKSMKIL